MHSPYGKDIVKQFVASCKKYNVTPAYYMGPNANGYFSNKLKLSAEEFVERQLGMLKELLTNYGTDYVSRLWWDHYPSGCGGLAPCPNGSFPNAWPQFVKLVRELSPSTIICPGPDCDGHQTESGYGKYPVWYPCTPESGPNGTVLSCGSHAANGNLTGFHPYETCATMQRGWFAKGNGLNDNSWTAATIWDHVIKSVGIGYINTLNAPPGTTGQINQQLARSMTIFGDAYRKLLQPVSPTASTQGPHELICGGGGGGGGVLSSSSSSSNGNDNAFIELDLGAPTTFNAVITREDLRGGQRIESYSVSVFDEASGTWKDFPKCNPGSCVPGSPSPHPIPSTPRGTCGPAMTGINLVDLAPPSCKRRGVVQTAAACQEICAKDAAANFWTWHDLTVEPASYRGVCYCREDTFLTITRRRTIFRAFATIP